MPVAFLMTERWLLTKGLYVSLDDMAVLRGGRGEAYGDKQLNWRGGMVMYWFPQSPLYQLVSDSKKWKDNSLV